MMTAGQQLQAFGVSAETIGDQVRITTRPGGSLLDASTAQRFAFYLAHAYMQAGPIGRSATGNVIIERRP